MSFRDCITSAMADGHISRDAGTEYIARYDELAEDIGGGSGKSWYEAKVEAAVRLQGEMERKLRRKKRMRLFHARAVDQLRARAVPSEVDKAMRAALDFDPKLEHVGPNVSMRHESLKGSAFALMSNFVDRFRSKTGGLTRETAGMGDVVKGLFGEKTSPEAKAFAEAVQEARHFLVRTAIIAREAISRGGRIGAGCSTTTAPPSLPRTRPSGSTTCLPAWILIVCSTRPASR